LKPYALLSLVAALSAVGAAAGPRKARLPDIRPLPGALLNRRIVVEGGRRLLRFDTSIENIGAGPVEVRGLLNKETNVMEAYQVLYTDKKLRHFRSQRIGEFEWHAEHRHWHLLQVAEYRLKNDAGEEVATGTKISFCLVDTAHSAEEIPYSPKLPRYRRCDNDASAKHFRVGISVGWSDLYNLGLYGQWIDITDVSPGDYQIEVELDPLNLIQERDESNNTVQVPVTIPAAED
jgi:hypothetical protein